MTVRDLVSLCTLAASEAEKKRPAVARTNLPALGLRVVAQSERRQNHSYVSLHQ